MQTSQTRRTSNAYGREIDVKCIYLGSIFRQFVLSRLNVNYFHYVWRMSAVLITLACIVLFLQKYFDNIPRMGIILLVISCIVASIVHCVMTEIIEESMEVINGIGIQLSSRGRFGKESKTLLEFNTIKDIIINEAVTMQRVLFYLALTINDSQHGKDTSHGKENQTAMIVLFKHTMPKLEELRNIYNEIQPFLCNHNKKDR